MKALVLYHGNCPDGFTSAWAAWLHLGDSAEYVPVNHDDDDIPDVTGRDVYILDFSYARDVILDMKEKATSFLVLDHHKSAESALDGIEGCHFDMDRSGAGMSWDHFHKGKPRSSLASYVEDRDLWRFDLPASKEINSVVTSHEFTFDNWDRLNRQLYNDFHKVAAEGEALLRSKDRYVEIMIESCSLTTSFLGFDNVPMVNAPHISISELVGRLSEGVPFAVGWRQMSNGKFIYSLRSREDGIDVSALAVHMGGGGHPAAAGFDSHLPPWDLAVDIKSRLLRDMNEDNVDMDSVPPSGMA